NTTISEIYTLSLHDALPISRLHDILYSKTSTFYEKLQQHQYRQLHFHLKDNRSFLRLHRVDKFGDDLSDFRPTVRAVNKTQKSVDRKSTRLNSSHVKISYAV